MYIEIHTFMYHVHVYIYIYIYIYIIPPLNKNPP